MSCNILQGFVSDYLSRASQNMLVIQDICNEHRVVLGNLHRKGDGNIHSYFLF